MPAGFSLMVDSDIFVNEQYLATITAINADGERNISVIVEFGKNECHSMNNIIIILTLYDCHININFLDTYDVQSVSGRAIAGGLELSCTFAEDQKLKVVY